MGLHLKKELVLDCSKWICGESSFTSENRLGYGNTELLNDRGYMCCLGQFSKQCGITNDELIGLGNPSELPRQVDGFAYRGCDTDLADDAISINDSLSTTVKEKIMKLKKLFAKKGVKIKVKNYKKATGKNWNE